jgi:hypothetical protein
VSGLDREKNGGEVDVLKTAEFEDWLAEQQPKLRTLVLSRLDLVS